MGAANAGAAAAGATRFRPGIPTARGPAGGAVSSLGVPLPGGVHARVRAGGNVAMAGLGALAYGVYEEAKVEDIAARALLTGQIKIDEGMPKSQAYKRVRDVIQNMSSRTGFSPTEVGEAILTTERQFGGIDFAKRMKVEETLLPIAAAEARMKETTLPEAFRALVGLMHMTGTFKPEELPEMGRQFAYASMITPVPLPQFERALSYSLPILHAGMGMDPGAANKIRVIQRRAYGLRNEDYLRLKVLTCMLPAL